MSKRRTGTPQVHTITSAPAPLGADIDRRARRYMIQMSLRTICFLGAVFTWGRIPTPISVSLLIGAVVLPYVAVVLANAGRERPDRADPFTDLDLAQLTAAPHVDVPPQGTAPRTHAPRTDRPVWDPDAWRPMTDGTPDAAPRNGPHRG